MAKKSFTPLPVGLQLKTSLGALGILYQRLGPVKTARVTASLSVAQAAGEPFKKLGPPADERDRLSRKQAAPAILLYRALREVLDYDQALALARDVVVDGAVRFLGHAVGPIDRDELLAMSPAEREAVFHGIGERFFNVTMRWDEITEDGLKFTVTDCRFPGLCVAGGAPEVAPLLCAGDKVYFEEVLGTVELTREHTLAGGGADCPFELRWKGR